jgi:alkylhydroperoxidase family enzyme
MDELPRLSPLTDAECTEEQRELLAPLGPNASLNLFRTMVRHPKLYRRWSAFAGRLLQRSALTDRERELVILRTSWRCGAAYEWGHHVEIGRAIGLVDEDFARLADEDTSTWSAHEGAVVRAADQLVADHEMDDVTWSTLADTWSDEQLIELTLLVGAYAMLAGSLRTLRIPVEPGLPALGQA